MRDKGSLPDTKPMMRREAAAYLASEAGAAPRFSLVIHTHDGAHVVPLRPHAGVVVGRHPPAEVVIADASLSRQHARFTLCEHGVEVEDLESMNGTWSVDERIDRAMLRAGDEVKLGTVHVSVHERRTAELAYAGLDRHDDLRVLLDAEVARAGYFGRGAAFLLARPHRSKGATPRAWALRVRSRLRPIDHIALYSDDTLEILLSEATPEQALALAATITAHDPLSIPLLCGFATYPDAATSSEKLIELARGALSRATVEAPLQAAPRTTQRTLLPHEPAISEEDVGPVFASAGMHDVLEMARRLARGVIPVLLQGETGTGKEVIAQFIHRQGPRKDRPLISVNCAAIPSQLIESTLFGHEKGAFTGANLQHKGVFEAAERGTVLLDEVGELLPPAQAALLRVLEAKTVVRVGSTREIPVDARVIAASHRDLEAMVEAGQFRRDLLYRLNAMTLVIPALRDRRGDIRPLAARFLMQANQTNGCEVTAIESDVLEVMDRYAWPGNVRELRNVIERAVVIARSDVIGLDDVPERLRAMVGPRAPVSLPDELPAEPGDTSARIASGEDFRSHMENVEIRVLLAGLRDAGWNQSAAARRLKMPLRTLVHKIRVYGLGKIKEEDMKRLVASDAGQDGLRRQP